MFMVITALVITGLAAWTGNDIKNVGNLQSARAELYAAHGAIQVAIANTRYTYTANSTGEFCPSTASQQSTQPMTLNNASIDVWCVVSTTTCPIAFCTRVVTMSAFPSAQCTMSCTGNPYVQTEILYDDITSGTANDCSPAGAQTTCGSTMVVYSTLNSVGSS